MRKKGIYLGLPIIILCAFLLLRNNKKNNIADYNSFLEKKAYELYDNEDYKNSVLVFSRLIQLDSTKGDFYYKRGIVITV